MVTKTLSFHLIPNSELAQAADDLNFNEFQVMREYLTAFRNKSDFDFTFSFPKKHITEIEYADTVPEWFVSDLINALEIGFYDGSCFKDGLQIAEIK